MSGEVRWVKLYTDRASMSPMASEHTDLKSAVLSVFWALGRHVGMPPGYAVDPLTETVRFASWLTVNGVPTAMPVHGVVSLDMTVQTTQTEPPSPVDNVQIPPAVVVKTGEGLRGGHGRGAAHAFDGTTVQLHLLGNAQRHVVNRLQAGRVLAADLNRECAGDAYRILNNLVRVGLAERVRGPSRNGRIGKQYRLVPGVQVVGGGA